MARPTHVAVLAVTHLRIRKLVNDWYSTRFTSEGGHHRTFETAAHVYSFESLGYCAESMGFEPMSRVNHGQPISSRCPRPSGHSPCGRPASNRQPPRWQRGARPIELLPLSDESRSAPMRSRTSISGSVDQRRIHWTISAYSSLQSFVGRLTVWLAGRKTSLGVEPSITPFQIAMSNVPQF